MEKQVIKIYCQDTEVPEYKTSGASGFDLKVKYTDKTCRSITTRNIEIIEHHNIYELIKDFNIIYNIIPDIDNMSVLHLMTDISIMKLLELAIINKLKEVNKLLESNNKEKYNNLYKYLDDRNISSVNMIMPFSHNILPTNIYAQIPEGYEIQIRPRSGIGAKTNMIAHFGTIDSDYRGNIGIIINNPSPNIYIIFPNERLAQGVFAKVEQCEFKKVKSIEELTKTDRGDGGFGSTGK